MKKHILILLVGLIAIIGCKKEKLTEAEAGNQKLQGKWQVTKVKNTSLKDGKVIEKEEEADGTLIFEFTGNRLSLTGDTNEAQSYSYTLEGNEIILRSEDNEAVFFKYNFNSDTQLSLTQSETVTQNNITYEDATTYVLTKI